MHRRSSLTATPDGWEASISSRDSTDEAHVQQILARKALPGVLPNNFGQHTRFVLR